MDLHAILNVSTGNTSTNKIARLKEKKQIIKKNPNKNRARSDVTYYLTGKDIFRVEGIRRF